MYRILGAGEIIKDGDEADAAVSWNDPHAWVLATRIGEPAPDPSYPAHCLYRRDMGSGGTSPVVGCAFGGGRSDKLPEIPLEQAVQVCHDISAKINAWACECEAQGARKCGGCE